MSIEISDYPDVSERAKTLGLSVPTGLAILPRNFDSALSANDLVFESSTPTVRKLWRNAGLTETRVDADGRTFPQVSEKSLVWLGPTIFIAATLVSQNSTAIAIGVNVISDYLNKHVFNGIGGSHSCRLDIVVGSTRNSPTKRIHYDGPVDGLPGLAQVVHEVSQL